MSSNRSRNIYLLLLISFFGVLYCLISWKLSALSISLPEAKAQIIVCIPVLWCFYLLLKPTGLFSRNLFIGCIVIGLFATGFTLSSVSIKSQTIFFAPLAEDELGAQTRIVRTTFLKSLARVGQSLSASPLYETVRSHQDAIRIIGNRKNVKGIFWGSTRQLSLTFQESISSQTIPKRGWSESLEDLRIITEIPYLDTPFHPLKETLHVIASALSDEETALSRGGSTVAAWRSSGQRGYLFYRLGTKQLIEALSGDGYQFQAVECAAKSLEIARKFSIGTENELLRRAIVSNLAVLSLVRGVYEKKGSDLKHARELTLRAARIWPKGLDKSNKALIDSIAVQRNNSEVIRLVFRKIASVKKNINHGRSGEQRHNSQAATSLSD